MNIRKKKASEVGKFRMCKYQIELTAFEAYVFQGPIRTKSICSRSVLMNIRNKKPQKQESSECVKARLELTASEVEVF
jgi:hypothetical protein